MTVVNAPDAFGAIFATILGADKRSFVKESSEGSTIDQHGATLITPNQPFPGWPSFDPATLAALHEAVIETYVITGDEPAMALSNNEPFVSTWLHLATWLGSALRVALSNHGLGIAGPSYVTASLTATALLEGQAHIDDDAFVPDDNVGVVAIVGQHVGPRIATQTLAPKALRPMSQVQYMDDVLQAFQIGAIDHCVAPADQIAVFPQFGQLHAGPGSDPLASLTPWRQLLVFRASVART